MKIGFLHYEYKANGVTTVSINNARGIKKKDPSYEVSLIAGNFEGVDSEDYNTLLIEDLINKEKPSSFAEFDKKAEIMKEKLSSVANEYDFLVIENPTIGLHPVQTFAYKKLADQFPDKIAYRIHDPVEELPAEFEYLNSFGKDYTDLVYPEKINYFVINSNLMNMMESNERLSGLDVSLLNNSIVPEDYEIRKDKQELLRENMRKDGFLENGEKIISYPGRAVERKNIEELILLTNIFNRFKKDNHKLIITVKETGYDHTIRYQQRLESIAKALDLNCVIGGVGEKYGFSKEDFFNMVDFYGISDVTGITSTREGFGYQYVESNLSEKPLIGRRLSNVKEDFTKNGIDQEGLYDALMIEYDGKDTDFGKLNADEKFDVLKNMDDYHLDKIVEKNKLYDKFKTAIDKKTIESNRSNIIKNYDYKKVAEQLIEYLNK